MPQAVPDYVQPEIRDVIIRLYPRGIKELSERMGRSYTTVLHTFKERKHVSLKLWIDFCSQHGADPDELSMILTLPPKERKEAFNAYFGVERVSELSSMDDGYAYGMLRGASARKIAETYKPLANSLGFSLSELAVRLI